MSPEQKPLISDVSYTALETWLAGHPDGMGEIAGLYYRAWQTWGLCPDEKTARKKVESFHPENTWLAVSREGNAVGAVHSVQLFVRSIDELFDAVPTYAHAERLAGDPPPGRVNVQVCFSLAVPERYRVTGPNGHSRTVAEGLLVTIPHVPGMRTIAYSKAAGVYSPAAFVQHIVSGLRDSSKLGPSGMHEFWGGIIVAATENSRREDRGGGGGNVLVARPIAMWEQDMFSSLKGERLQTAPDMRVVASSNASSCMWVFGDVERRVELFPSL